MSRVPCCQAEIDGEPCTCNPVQFSEAKHAINITVRSFATGDGEGQHFWDEPEAYIPHFPGTLQPAIRNIINSVNSIASWVAEETIMLLLEPYIEHYDLYLSDYPRWEHNLLEGELI